MLNLPVISLRASIAFSLTFIVLARSARGQDPISIERHDPTADRVMFDRKNPPADMPRLKPGEAALCQYNFDCNVNMSYEVTEQTQGGASSYTVTARLRRVKVTVALHNRIYLPNGAPPKIRAHEEGHRIINERAYEAAQEAARAAAMDVLTRTWTGTGDTPEAAGKNATDQAVKALCDAYLARTATVASRVGDIYDELTSHGRNTKLKESDAIGRAFDQLQAEKSSADKR